MSCEFLSYCTEESDDECPEDDREKRDDENFLEWFERVFGKKICDDEIPDPDTGQELYLSNQVKLI